VAEARRYRASGDTLAWLAWSRRPRFERAFVRTLMVAFVLHLPLLPVPIYEVIWLALFSHTGDYDDPDAQAIVPIDLDLLGKEIATEPPPEPPKPPPAPIVEGSPDGGITARPSVRPPPPPAEQPDAGAADAGPPIADPTKAAGGAGKIAAKDPNVQVLISGKVLRHHELGPWASSLLLMIPEWHSFFEGSPIDPIKDLDHLLITAPRLKDDSSKMVAVLQYNVHADRVRDAVDAVLHRTNGVWLEDAPVTVARARVGNAPRLFAILPERRLLVILPAEAMDQLEGLKKAKNFRNSAEGAVVSLLTPAKPFKEFLPLPETLKWLRLALTPAHDGGVDLAIEAGDRSAADAQADAEKLTRDIEGRRKVEVFGRASVEIVDAVKFVAEGETIRARTHVPPEKMRLVMWWIEQKARERYGGG
jgi:hypothetical protein